MSKSFASAISIPKMKILIHQIDTTRWCTTPLGYTGEKFFQMKYFPIDGQKDMSLLDPRIQTPLIFLYGAI